MTRAHVGTSGWNYPEWKDGFYAGVRRKDWLRHCAERFTGIEVNATFYRSLKPETYARWREQTPAGFRFAVKGHRIVTHLRRLRDPEESLRIQRDALSPLGDRLAVVLWQTPANLHKDVEILRGFVKALRLWRTVRHVLEFRHRSWFDAETAECLQAREVGTAISDAESWPLWDTVTSDIAYVRLHGHTRTYASAYAPRSLASWAERTRAWLREGREVHVYFDNTAEGAAPRDAERLLRRLGRETRRS